MSMSKNKGTQGILRECDPEADQRRPNQAFEKVFQSYQSAVLHRVCHCVLGCWDAALLPGVVTSKSAVHWTR